MHVLSSSSVNCECQYFRVWSEGGRAEHPIFDIGVFPSVSSVTLGYVWLSPFFVFSSFQEDSFWAAFPEGTSF